MAPTERTEPQVQGSLTHHPPASATGTIMRSTKGMRLLLLEPGSHLAGSVFGVQVKAQ